MKPHVPTGRACEHAIERERTHVYVEIEGPTKSFEHGDAAAPVAHAAPTRPGAQVSLDGAVEDAHHGPTENTHCRTGTSGSTWSTRCAARSAIRRPPQLGQKPRPLHENATRRSEWQVSQRNRANPAARKQRRNALNSASTNRGSPWPSRRSDAATQNVSTCSRTTV